MSTLESKMVIIIEFVAKFYFSMPIFIFIKNLKIAYLPSQPRPLKRKYVLLRKLYIFFNQKVEHCAEEMRRFHPKPSTPLERAVQSAHPYLIAASPLALSPFVRMSSTSLFLHFVKSLLAPRTPLTRRDGVRRN